jgi:hypothetical protein
MVDSILHGTGVEDQVTKALLDPNPEAICYVIRDIIEETEE